MQRRNVFSLLWMTVLVLAISACAALETRTPSAAPPAAPGAAGTPGASSGPQLAAQPAGAGAPSTAASLPYRVNANAQGEITFWHFWGSALRRNAIQRVIAGFQQSYPNIKVKETFVPFGDIWTRNTAAVTAGSGMPDVIVEDRPQLRARAANKIATNLGDLARRDSIDGSAFWPFTWQESTVDGQPYGLPYETDIRVLYWNKAAFMDAGLDPEKPPRTWDELWSYADKLDIKGSDGRLQRIGFHPLVGGMGADIWAWTNNAEFTNNGTLTVNTPAHVETLEWIRQWDERYGKQNLDAFIATFGPQNSPQDRFMSGKIAMLVDIGGYTSFLNTFNFNPETTKEPKQRLGWGMAPVPASSTGRPVSLSGGFALAIPRGAKNVDAAWEFIKYATFVGQQSWARDTYSMPTVEKLAKEDPILNVDPRWQILVKAMEYGRPAEFNLYYPAWGSEYNKAVDDMRIRGSNPKAALDEAQKRIDAEIARKKGS